MNKNGNIVNALDSGSVHRSSSGLHEKDEAHQGCFPLPFDFSRYEGSRSLDASGGDGSLCALDEDSPVYFECEIDLDSVVLFLNMARDKGVLHPSVYSDLVSFSCSNFSGDVTDCPSCGC